MSKHQIQPLQYITHGSPEEQIQQAKDACEAGIRWIQLRLKNVNDLTLLKAALEVKAICTEYNAVFIVNDHVHIALAADADGVHLGKEDSTPKDARILLGPDKIIGGTSNTLEDIVELAAAQVDYIGLGPYRFTSTKQNLSPILGVRGFQEIIKRMAGLEKSIPLIAIGGILPEDIPELKSIGVHGIALSSALILAKNRKEMVTSIMKYDVKNR